MTARRRRRSGSGPSAAAVIAWVGGAKTIAEHAANRAFPDQNSVAALMGDRRALPGHVRSVAMGSALAAASLLGMTVHAGDGAPGAADAAGLPPAPTPRPPAAAPAPAEPQSLHPTLAADRQAPVPTQVRGTVARTPSGARPGAVGWRAGHDAEDAENAEDAERAGSSDPAQPSSYREAAAQDGTTSEFGSGQSRQQPGESQSQAEPGTLRGALAPVASAPRQALDTAHQALAPVTSPVTSRLSAPATRSSDADAAAQLGTSVDRTATMLAETGQPALSMLPGSGLGW